MSSNGLTYLNNSLDGNVVLFSPSFQLRFGFVDFFCMSAILLLLLAVELLLLLAVEWSVVVVVVVGVVRVVVGMEACTINGNGSTAVGRMMNVVRMQKYMRRLLL